MARARFPVPRAWLAAGLAAAPAVAADAPEAGREQAPVRGMTVSCQTWGWEWGSDAMVEAMAELRELGVNWISIHPYAGIRADGRVVVSRRYAEPRWLRRPVEEARRLGLQMMIKPHLAYWGSPFEWRGEISFDTEEQWQRFFDGYERWITRVAGICHDADALAVGTELDGTVHREAQWRRVIRSVRKRYGGPITYSANWTDYEKVPFWDAVDVIGIQAYFPLAEEPGLPEPGALRRAWEKRLDRLEKFSHRANRRVVLAELGYSRSAHAAVRPWDGREGGPDAEQVQVRCLSAALAALEDEEHVVGAFLWKWFPGPARHENFLMSTPAMRRVIAAYWKQ